MHASHSMRAYSEVIKNVNLHFLIDISSLEIAHVM